MKESPSGNSGTVTATAPSNEPSSSETPSGIKVQASGKYKYQITAGDLTREQQAFQPGEGVSCLHLHVHNEEQGFDAEKRVGGWLGSVH